MVKIFSYDKDNDILVIHKGFSKDERFKGNIDIGDLILDVSTKGRIRGIEIINASRFLKDFDIGRKILNNIIDVKFNASIRHNSIILGISIKAKDIKQEIPLKVAVPLDMPKHY